LKGVGVVAALAAEARALGPKVRRADGLFALKDASLLAISGIGAPHAALAARNLIAAGASSLMSFGLAGGLDPRLLAGTVVVPDEVISRDGVRCATAREWREEMRRQVQKARTVACGNLLTCAQPIGEIADKAQAFRDTGAVAVDMESLPVAQVAAQHGVPFIAVRVIVDTATDVLPGSVLAASGSGTVDIRRLLTALALAPRDLLGLLRLARRYRVATRSLSAVAVARVA
jgi:adenosylhomocysteine nucleosidase